MELAARCQLARTGASFGACGGHCPCWHLSQASDRRYHTKSARAYASGDSGSALGKGGLGVLMNDAFKIADLYLLSPELSLTLLALVVMGVDLVTRRRIVVVTTALIGLIVPIGFAISQIFT